MSAHFAIPATSFVLKQVIDARLKVAYGAFPAPAVLLAPPPRSQPQPPAGGGAEPEPTSLILFMHHAGANPSWRNMYDPPVDSAGVRVGKSPLVLDLYYMLAATGAGLERETLLGVGMSALHRNGIVPRAMIANILGKVVVPPVPNTLMEKLTSERLFDPAMQLEQITISQQPVDIDMSTKLWSALSSPIRPCAYYLVTTVFLDTGEDFAAPAPVTEVAVAARPGDDMAALSAAPWADVATKFDTLITPGKPL